MVLSTQGWVLPVPTNIIKTISYRHAHRPTKWRQFLIETSSHVGLTVKANHHGWFAQKHGHESSRLCHSEAKKAEEWVTHTVGCQPLEEILACCNVNRSGKHSMKNPDTNSHTDSDFMDIKYQRRQTTWRQRLVLPWGKCVKEKQLLIT